MQRHHHRINPRDFEGGLVEAFRAGYHAAVALVEAETGRPAMQKLTFKELEVMLRRQCDLELSAWTQR